MNIAIDILMPFVGTVLGAACVFFMKDAIEPIIQKMLLGFASGVMVAASTWPLLVPAMKMSEDMGKLAFIPATVGLLVGMRFLPLMDKIIPHLHLDHEEPEGIRSSPSKTTMLVLAVTLHDIPGRIVVGVVFAGMLTEDRSITTTEIFALAISIAIQSFPEGAIISMPLKNEGKNKDRAFLLGTLSGIMEPIGATVTILLASYIAPIPPYLLSFAAGAMLYTVVEELIPEASEGKHTNIGTLGFAVGFVIMVILDVALG